MSLIDEVESDVMVISDVIDKLRQAEDMLKELEDDTTVSEIIRAAIFSSLALMGALVNDGINEELKEMDTEHKKRE